MHTTHSVLNPAMLDAIVDRLDTQWFEPDLLQQLRLAYPGVHFTLCMDDDVSENAKPIITRARYNLYLVNSSQHCSILTNDIETASGMVIAELYIE